MVRLALCSWLAAAALFAGQAGAFLHTPQVGGCFLPSRSVCDSSYRSQRVELAAAAGPVLSAALVGGAGATFSGANSHVLRMLLAGRSRHAGVCRAQLGETAFHSNESACYEEVDEEISDYEEDEDDEDAAGDLPNLSASDFEVVLRGPGAGPDGGWIPDTPPPAPRPAAPRPVSLP
ncbi:hypothetical protein T484DRAFT_2020598, partial [Baffinella frigidus]